MKILLLIYLFSIIPAYYVFRLDKEKIEAQIGHMFDVQRFLLFMAFIPVFNTVLPLQLLWSKIHTAIVVFFVLRKVKRICKRNGIDFKTGLKKGDNGKDNTTANA